MNTRLGDLLFEKGNQVLSVTPEETVLDAVKRMKEKKVGALLVLANNKPIGIFTERDVLDRVIACGCNPIETKVSEVMTKKLAVVSPNTTVQEAMVICTEKRCRHLPVMKEDELLGIISSGDLTQWATKSQNHEIQNLVRYITGQYPG